MSRPYQRAVASTSRVPRATWAAVLVLGLMPQIGQAQSPDATILHQFAWDYPDAWIAEFNIVRFEIRIDIDSGVAASVGMSNLSDQPGSYTAPVPAMTVGQHLLEVRACSPVTCGVWSGPL